MSLFMSLLLKDKEKTINEIITTIKPLKPEKVILFGSYAWGEPDKDSDIDLYVVTNDDFVPQNYNEKMSVYLNVARQLQDFLSKYPTDLIVHTRSMHNKFVEKKSLFSKKIMEKGIVLYERQ